MSNPPNLFTGKECTDREMHELSDLQFSVEQKPWNYGISIYIGGRNYNLKPYPQADFYIVTGFVTEKHDITKHDSDFASPLSCTLASAQQLMDGLWKAGIRPNSKLVPSPVTLDAVQHHLADMRKIAYKFLELEE